jgi:hypothetical protein
MTHGGEVAGPAARGSWLAAARGSLAGGARELGWRGSRSGGAWFLAGNDALDSRRQRAGPWPVAPGSVVGRKLACGVWGVGDKAGLFFSFFNVHRSLIGASRL